MLLDTLGDDIVNLCDKKERYETMANGVALPLQRHAVAITSSLLKCARIYDHKV